MEVQVATSTHATRSVPQPVWRRLLSFNALLALVPFAVAAHYADAPPVFTFVAAALALVPLALLVARTTEALSRHFNPTVASLLNASAGNLIELLIAYFALRAGLIDVIKASLVGSILVNILLLIGLSVFVGGLRFPRQPFNRRVAGVASSMLLVATVGMALPTVYGLTTNGPTASVSRAISIALGFMYVLSLVFTLFTHRSVFRLAQAALQKEHDRESMGKALVVLGAATVAGALVAEALVGSIQPVAVSLHLSQAFIGLVVIAILTNVAEHVGAVTYALRNQMDLALNIGMNSATQIALFAAPIIVLLGWAMGQPMSLVFSPFELVSMVASVIVLNHMAANGECTWLEGAQLLTVYLIVVIAFYFLG